MANPDRKKAWEACARYCKIRDCLKVRGFAFLGRCITCDRNYHIVNLEAGHAISGRRNAVLFDVAIIHPQCSYCNQVMHGRQKRYRKILAEIHGEEWMANRERRAKRVIKDSQIDFVKLQKGFESKYKVMMESYGFHTWKQLLAMDR